MNTNFQNLIIEIATAHGLDLSAHYAHLTLEMKGYIDLVIEKWGNNISVGHWTHDNLPDPLFTFVPTTEQNIWLPFLERMLFFGGKIRKVSDKMDAMEFCNGTWAENLFAQGWRDHATVKQLFNATPGSAWWIRANGQVRQISPEGQYMPLKQMQEFVDGYIEFLPQVEQSKDYAWIGNEEAKLVNEPVVNWIATRLLGTEMYGDVICGDVILVSEDRLEK